MSRESNIEVFRDSCARIANTKELQDAIAYTNQYMQILPEGKELKLEPSIYSTSANIAVVKSGTFDAARSLYEKLGGNVAALNFASATTAGGGVVKGATAQEECLCRCSTLYNTISNEKCWNEFYKPHRDNLDPLHNDDIIWTPKVAVFKADDYSLLKSPYPKIDVITCAAPNLREKNVDMFNVDKAIDRKVSNEELYNIHYKRACRIFDVAYKKKVDHIVVGAFGCGAFKNNPATVAKAWKDAAYNKATLFKTIVFAIYDGPYSNNFEVFKEIIKPE